jgi:hypothetical protein
MTRPPRGWGGLWLFVGILSAGLCGRSEQRELSTDECD